MFEIGQLTRLPLGYVGENGTRTISIDMKAWLDEYPGALIMIQVIRPVDHYKYPAAYTKTDGVIHWTVDGAEVMYAGKGLAQIALYNPDTKQEYKSRVVGTIVAESLDGFNDIMLEETDPASKWVNRVLEAAESAEASKNDAANSKEEAAAAVAIVSMQKNEALIAIQNEGAAQVVSVNEAGARQAQFVEAKGEEVLGKIPEDYTELSKNVATLTEDIARNTAPPIVPTATGEIVTVSDSAHRPLAGLRLYGKTTQDGIPTPNSSVPMVNVGAGGSIEMHARGKNLWSLGDIVAIYYTAPVADAFRSLAPNEQYTLSWKYSSNGTADVQNTMIVYTDAGSINIANGMPFTITKAQLRTLQAAYAYFGSDMTSGSMTDIVLSAGSVATAYEPYKDGGSLTASTPNGLPGIPVTSGGNYTDASGQQWVCDYKDYERGVHVQRIIRRTLNGTEGWAVNNEADNKYTYFWGVHDVGASECLCDKLTAAYTYELNAKDNIVAVTPEYNGVIYLRASGYMTEDTPSALKAMLAQYTPTVMYALATPIETPIPADEMAAYRAMMSQYPHTTVYNDAGAGMAVDYIADTQLYINNKLAAIAAATL